MLDIQHMEIQIIKGTVCDLDGAFDIHKANKRRIRFIFGWAYMVFILHLIRDNILARKNGNVRPSESTKTVTEKFLKNVLHKIKWNCYPGILTLHK